MSTSNSGYGEYLEEQQNQQQPAAPTTRAVDGYGQFLETLANNKRIENTPTNAKTYADYLTYLGQDPVGDYNAKVRQANLEYQKGLATYGQNAEKMAKSGLVGSGYGEYLTGIAYQGKQSAVGAAQREAKAAIDKGFASYGDYIEGLKSTNEQNAIAGIISGELEGDEARDYARKQGVTEDRIEHVITQTATTIGEAKAKKKQEAMATLANATSAVSALVDGGQTIDSAIASLNGVYDSEVLESVRANIQSGTNKQFEAAIGGQQVVTNYKATLDQQLASGAITKEQHAALVTAGSAKNLELINALRNDSSKTAGLMEYINALSDDEDETGADVWAEMDTDEQSEKIAEWVEEMHSSGILTREDYQKFFYQADKKSLENASGSTDELIQYRENIATRLQNGQISQEQYNELVSMWSAKENCAGDVAVSRVVTNRSPRTGKITSYTIQYAQVGKGGEDIDLRMLKETDSSNFVKKLSAGGRQIGFVGSTPAIMIGEKCYTFDYYHTDDNEDFWNSIKK